MCWACTQINYEPRLNFRASGAHRLLLNPETNKEVPPWRRGCLPNYNERHHSASWLPLGHSWVSVWAMTTSPQDRLRLLQTKRVTLCRPSSVLLLLPWSRPRVGRQASPRPSRLSPPSGCRYESLLSNWECLLDGRRGGERKRPLQRPRGWPSGSSGNYSLLGLRRKRDGEEREERHQLGRSQKTRDVTWKLWRLRCGGFDLPSSELKRYHLGW